MNGEKGLYRGAVVWYPWPLGCHLLWGSSRWVWNGQRPPSPRPTWRNPFSVSSNPSGETMCGCCDVLLVTEKIFFFLLFFSFLWLFFVSSFALAVDGLVCLLLVDVGLCVLRCCIYITAGETGRPSSTSAPLSVSPPHATPHTCTLTALPPTNNNNDRERRRRRCENSSLFLNTTTHAHTHRAQNTRTTQHTLLLVP